MTIIRADEAIAGVVVGRRPVVDEKLQVHAQRIVVYGSDGEVPLGDEVVDRVALLGGIDQVVGAHTAFVAPVREYLTGERQIGGIPDGSVVEVDAFTCWDRPAVEGCRSLVQTGMKLAVALPGQVIATGSLHRLASYFCVDVGAVRRGLRLDGPPAAADLVERARSTGAKVIAVNVDTQAQFAEARRAGFELFQGRFLSTLPAVTDDALTPARMACLELLEKVSDPTTSAADLERVVASDPALGYRLLHISGLGAQGGLRRPVRSVREAAVLLGRDYIRRWLVLMMMADANQGTPEQLLIAITRARMCERIAAEACPSERDAAFTVGLVSALHLLLGSSLPEVVSKLAIQEDLKRALLDHDGWLGGALSDVLDWEGGDLPVTLRTGLDPVVLEGLYLEALAWAGGMEASLMAAA